MKNPINSFENKQYYPVYNFFFLIIVIFLDKIFSENIREIFVFSIKEIEFLIQIKEYTKFLILIDITELNSLEKDY